jgi:uncharacterized membrane protein HdeD (DUF308 family)
MVTGGRVSFGIPHAVLPLREERNELMRIILAKNWWSLLVRGIAAIAFAVITVISPGITVGALVLLFGAYALVDGTLSIVGAVRAARAHERWSVLVLEGVAGIAASAVTVVLPIATTLALVAVAAAWALITGALEIVAAIKLRRQIANEWLLALSGVVSLIAGALLIAMPFVGAIAIALVIGVYAFVFGCLLIALAFRLRKWIRNSMPDSDVRVADWQQHRTT